MFIANKQTESVQGRYSSSSDGNNAVVTVSVDTYTPLDTDVEWSNTKVSAGGSEASFVTTSHLDNGEAGQSALVSNIILGNASATITDGVQIIVCRADCYPVNGLITAFYGV